jgi:IS30 family transposase
MSESEAIGQAEQLNQSFRIPLKKGEFEANCRYAAEVAMSDPMEPGRRRYDYKYAAKLAIKNVTLVEWLAIDDSEQSHMKTILNKQEKLKRLTDKRRKEGVKPREEYLGTAQDKKAQAIRLRQEGMTVAQIANQLGTSERTVKRYCNS